MRTLLPDVNPTRLRDGYTVRPRRVKPARRPSLATARIVDAYLCAVADSLSDTRYWYWQARSWCEYRAIEYGHSVEVVAGVLAALSPGTSWEENKRDVIEVLKHKADAKVRTYKANLRKALRILAGEHPGAVLRSRALESRRNKTWTFWYNITQPWRRDKVTIDRHAVSVALGRVATPRERSLSNYRYRCYEAAYLEAARQLKVPAPQIQAVTWCWWRETV